MKIERLHLIGFGKWRNCFVAFDPEKANLLIEENEFGKSTILAAIVAALYGFPPRERTTDDALSEKETFRPDDGGPYRVTLEVRVPTPQKEWVLLRIWRDFERGQVQVFNLSEGGKDITGEFVRRRGETDVGGVLLDLSREQFVNTCLVRQGALQEFSDLRQLTERLQQIADTEAGRHTAARAIQALERALREFPSARMGKGPLQIETEIRRTQQELTRIRSELKRLDEERHRLEPDLQRIRELEQRIEQARRRYRVAQYLRERAELGEIEHERKRREELEQRKRALNDERESLSLYETVSADWLDDMERRLEEWKQLARDRENIAREWERDRNRLAEIQAQQAELRSLAAFTQEDRDALCALVSRYEELGLAISQTREHMRAEEEALARRGIRREEFEQLRACVGALTPEVRRHIREAHARAHELERACRLAEEQAKEHRDLCDHIARERERQRRQANRAFTLALLGASSALIAYFLESDSAAILLALLALLGLSLGLIRRYTARTHRASEWERARAAGQRAREELERARDAHRGLYEEIRPLLNRTGHESLDALLEACDRFDRLVHELSSYIWQRARLQELEREQQEKQDRLREFLHRAGRPDIEPTPEALAVLIEDLDRLFELKQQQERYESEIARRSVELQDLQDQQRKQCQQILQRLREACAADLPEDELSPEQLEEILRQLRKKWERLKEVRRELQATEQALNGLRPLSELDQRRRDLRERLRQQEAEDPALASLSPERSPQAYADEAARWSTQEREAQKELSDLRVHIAAALHRLETERPKLLEHERELERHRAHVQNFKEAVERARDVFQYIASQIHGEWSNALTYLSQKLLAELNTDYEALYFDPTLRVRVSLKDQGKVLQPNQMRSQLSFGVREQLNLILRVAVSRYLSHDRLLPLILDEPFAHSDDKRFARLMRLLIEDLAREHQVILASCHRQRHEWFRAQDPSLFDQRVHLCQVIPSSPSTGF